jgi:hypothetical protein
MTAWRLFANSGVLIEHGGTGYLPVFGEGAGVGVQRATESEVQAKAYTAYTFSDLRLRVSMIGPTATFHLRDDGADVSALDVSFSASGWFETIASGSVAANSLFNYEVDHSAAMHNDTLTVQACLVTYEHATTESPLFGGSKASSQSADRFIPFSTSGAINATEARTETRFKRSQALSNLRVNCIAASSLTSTFALRKDGVTSTAVTVSVNGTGVVEDTTGSESYAAGDDGCFIWDFSAGSGTVSIWQAQADSAETFLGWSTLTTRSITTREYPQLHGDTPITSATDNYDWRGGSATAANLQTYVTGAGSGTRDVTLRVASTDSTTVTISVTATGLLEDATGSQAVGDTDHVGFSVASTGTAIQISRITVELPWSSGSGAVEKRPERMIPIVQHRPRALSARW